MPSSGDALTYNGYQWTNTSGGSGGGGSTLDSLSDVSAAGANFGDVIEYNGSSWSTSNTVQNINYSVSSLQGDVSQLQTDVQSLQMGGGMSSLSSLMDVSASSPSDGDYLKYDAMSMYWANSTFDTDVQNALPQPLGTTDAPEFQDLLIKKAAQLDGSDPTAITLRSTKSSSAWTPNAAVCAINFNSDDASGAGAGTRGQIAMKVQSSNGAAYGLHFSVDHGANGLREVFRYDKDTRFQVAFDTQTGHGKFNVFTSSNSQPILFGQTLSTSSAELIHLRNDAGTELWSVDNDANVVFKSGAGCKLTEGGPDAKMGIVTLSSGTATVSTTAITNNSRIMLSVNGLGSVSTPQAIAVNGRTAGVSFNIVSASNIDTSNVFWQIFEPV